MADMRTVLAADNSSIKTYVNKNIELTAFVNIIKPQIALILIGAGNDAIPIVKMGELLGWKVTVADGRPDYANKKRFSSGCQVVVTKPEKIFSCLDLDSQTIFVLMTHNYNYDLAMLRQLLQLDVRYIGILGSRGKISRMVEELINEGIDVEKKLSKIYSPVGIDIGAESPEEIALSIVSEIQSVLSGHPVKHLRFQDNPVHPRAAEKTKTIN